MTPLESLPKYSLLRPYQVEDINKLLRYRCSACFNEQRTGKTPIAISVMEAQQLDKILIVCPASMIYPWRDAYKFWTDKDALVCVGTPQKRLKIIDTWEHGPLIISYGCLKETIRTGGMLDDVIRKKPDACIADEAHHFKCPTTATAKAMYKLANVCKYRLALTGTPATNKPVDIFGILHFHDKLCKALQFQVVFLMLSHVFLLPLLYHHN
jgi:SNF2 family DNA or RNA helicase